MGPTIPQFFSSKYHSRLLLSTNYENTDQDPDTPFYSASVQITDLFLTETE